MTYLNETTPTECDPASVCECQNPCVICQCNEPLQYAQAPYMGSALRYFLIRYAADIRPYAEGSGDRVATSMLDCCNHLLVEADRLERGQR